MEKAYLADEHQQYNMRPRKSQNVKYVFQMSTFFKIKHKFHFVLSRKAENLGNYMSHGVHGIKHISCLEDIFLFYEASVEISHTT